MTTPITHPPKLADDAVALIDSDVFCVSAAAVSESEGESPDECVERFMGMIRLACAELRARPLLCLGTSRTFRHEIYADYKKGRPDKPNKAGRDAIRKAIPLNYEVAQGDNCETDDVLAAIQGTLSATTIIVTNDKDLDQIAGWHFNPMGKHRHKWAYPVSDEQAYEWFLIQWLTGDRTDNIPGIKGVGPAKARKIIDGGATLEEIRAMVDESEDVAKAGLDADATAALLKMDTDCKYTITDPLVAEAVQEYGDVEAVPY